MSNGEVTDNKKKSAIIIFGADSKELSIFHERLSIHLPKKTIMVCNDIKKVRSALNRFIPEYIIVIVRDIEADNLSAYLQLSMLAPESQIVFHPTNPVIRYLMKDAQLFGSNAKDKQVSKDNRNVSDARICIQNKGEAMILPVEEIEYFQSDLRKCIISIGYVKYDTYCKLSDIEQMELEGFVRCHKSYYVNLMFVKKVLPNQIELLSGEIIPVSQRKVADVRTAINNFEEFFPGKYYDMRKMT